jgi:hypothetical protein
VTVEVAEDAEGEIDFTEVQVTADSGTENPETIQFSTLDPEYAPNNGGSTGSSLWWLWILIAIVALLLIIAIAFYIQKNKTTETAYVAAPAEAKPYQINSNDKEDLISSIKPARRISTKYVNKP